MRLLAITLNWALVVVLFAVIPPVDMARADLWEWALVALMYACPIVNLIAFAATPPGWLSLYFARKAAQIRKLDEEREQGEEGTTQEPEQD